jgi:Na+-driven multidrug efflux pump
MGAAGLWWGLLIALTGAAIVLVGAWRTTVRALAMQPAA